MRPPREWHGGARRRPAQDFGSHFGLEHVEIAFDALQADPGVDVVQPGAIVLRDDIGEGPLVARLARPGRAATSWLKR